MTDFLSACVFVCLNVALSDGYLNNPEGLSAVVKHYLAYGHAEQGGIDGGPVRAGSTRCSLCICAFAHLYVCAFC